MTNFGRPDGPGWSPQTERELRAVIDQGLLSETHYLDMKREFGEGGRKETARDLAAFALDGGALLLGVAEDKEARTWTLTPQSLNGLAERVEQTATHLVDPALFVESTEIPSEEEPGMGYLFVRVPPSPVAPHMVEGIYFGRGDKTRVRLSDVEVLKFHTRRESLEAKAERLLDEEVLRDPVPVPEQKFGRLYLVAQPVTGRKDMALPLVRGEPQQLRDIVNASETALLSADLQQFAPTPSSANHISRRAHGTALCSSAVTGPGRTFHREAEYVNETDMLDFEFQEDGGIRILMGRMTDVWGRTGVEPAPVIADGLAVAYALRLTRWTERVGEKSGYRGSWVLGMHASGLRGLASAANFNSWPRRFQATPYDRATWRETTVASHAELMSQPHEVAKRLVGSLLRGLGTDQLYASAFTPGEA